MNEPFEFTLSNLGAIGIGLVWGWWCVLRFRMARRAWFNGLIALIFTTILGFMIGWLSERPLGFIFSCCAAGSAFFHYWWLQHLQKHSS